MNEDKKFTCSATLDLVLPPLANSDAKRLQENAQAEAVIRRSDFYMICGRAEAKFSDFNHDGNSGLIHFNISVADVTTDSGWIVVNEIPYFRDSDEDHEVQISYGAKYFQLSIVQTDGSIQPIIGFNPEYILFLRGRKDPMIGGLASHLDLATYELLYVGIAKVGDSYDRLFAKGHKARMEILANEPQRFPGARVSDETYLFLFEVDPLFINVFGGDSSIEDSDINFQYHQKQIVADAEKAFVSLLKPNYNSTLYPNYPKGADGLYGSRLTAYTYSISEGMAFTTKFGRIKGGRERHITLSNEADFILVEGDAVTFHISGVDFKVD